jgi:hypothetical protein
LIHRFEAQPTGLALWSDELKVALDEKSAEASLKPARVKACDTMILCF